MSSHWKLRFSIYTVIGIGLLAYGLTDSTYGQKRGIIPPPESGDESGAPEPGRVRPGVVRPPTASDRRGVSTTTAKPRFVNLLESKDLSQFRGYAQEEIGEGWSLDGKELYFDGSGGGDIITKEVFGDFDLQVEWKVADGANSGIMYRVSLGDDAPYMSGPEYQILDDAEHSDGKNELTAAGSLYGMYAAKDKTLQDVGNWNKTRIVAEGNKVTHYLNGKKVLEAEFGSDDWNKRLGESKFKDWEKYGKNTEGHIAFQDHGNEVWYRNIRIKRLGSSEPAAEEVADEPPKKGTQPRPGSKAALLQGFAPPAEDGGKPDK